VAISHRTITAVLATALSMSTAMRAGVQTTAAAERSSPVKVTSCKVTSELLSTDVDHPSEIVAGRLWFSLTNEWPEPATQVKLRIRYGALQSIIVEFGDFSRGVRVERTSDVTAYARWVGNAPQACTVISVKFANGAAWMPAADDAPGAG
jgi:hypothetical protein